MIRAGHIKLEVTPQQLSVRMIDGETHEDADGYVITSRPPLMRSAAFGQSGSHHSFVGSETYLPEEDELR